MGIGGGGNRPGRAVAWTRRDSNELPIAAADPYLEWARATRYRYMGGADRHERLELIIELSGMSARQFALGEWDPPSGWRHWLRIPALYANPASGLDGASYCTATVSADFFTRLRSHASLSRIVRRVALGAPVDLQPGVDPAVKPRPRGAAKPGLVATGIIDDGFAFAHERFRRSGKTRIEYLWRQDGSPVPEYGAELRKHGSDGIDDAISDCRHAGLVDEDELYRLTGHIDFRRGGHHSPAMRASHGTHVMDLACGFDEHDATDSRPMIGVQLPLATTADTSGGSLATHVLDGLHYILQRADAIALREQSGPLPAVVNLSYGLIAGPHDGRSILEAAIDQLIELRNEQLAVPFAVVIPSGNSRHARCHASFRLENTGAEQPLDWRVLPDDATPSYMELWLPPAIGSGPRPKLAIQVTPPGGDASPWISEGEIYAWQSGERVLCEAIYFNTAASPGSRNVILIALAETSTLERGRVVAPAGNWRVRVRNAGPAATFDAWIQRDDTPYGYPARGRQSHFDDPAYSYRDDAGRLIEVDNQSYIKRAGTLNALGTGDRSTVIGGYQRDNWKAAEYSAEGPAVPAATRAGPDAMAPSEDSEVCRGILAAGTRSGSRVSMNGTSVAAPQVTRWVADRMAAGAPCDRNAVFLLGQASDPVGAPPLPASRKGGGRVNFAAASKIPRR